MTVTTSDTRGPTTALARLAGLLHTRGAASRRVLARAVAAAPTVVGLAVLLTVWRSAGPLPADLGIASGIGIDTASVLPATVVVTTLGLGLLVLLVAVDRHLATVAGGEVVSDRAVAATGLAFPVTLLLAADVAASAEVLPEAWYRWSVPLLLVPVLFVGGLAMDLATWLLPASPTSHRSAGALGPSEVATFRHDRPRPPRGASVLAYVLVFVGVLALGPVGVAVGCMIPVLLGWERPTVVVNRHGLLVELRRRQHRLAWTQVLDVRALDHPRAWWAAWRWWGSPVSGWRRTEVLEVVLVDGTRRYVACREAGAAAALARQLADRAVVDDPPAEQEVAVLPAPSLLQRLRGEQVEPSDDPPTIRVLARRGR